MGKFRIEPHERLQEWVAEEKAYFWMEERKLFPEGQIGRAEYGVAVYLHEGDPRAR